MPASARSPWGAAIDAILADGKWHHRDELLEAATPLVPPGVAYREGERRRMTSGHGAPEARTRGDQAAAVTAGARSRATDVIKSRVRFGTVERDGDRYRKAAR